MNYRRVVAGTAIVCSAVTFIAHGQEGSGSRHRSPGTSLSGIQVAAEDPPLTWGSNPQENRQDPQSLTGPLAQAEVDKVDSILERERNFAASTKRTATSPHDYTADGSLMAPPEWCQPSYIHNAIADYIRLQWCADGLWDGYAAERAAQCAKQWQRIYGGRHHRCGGCCHSGVHAFSGHCPTCRGARCGAYGSCGCAENCHGGGSCGRAAMNRYRMHRPFGCYECLPLAAPGCDADCVGSTEESVSNATGTRSIHPIQPASSAPAPSSEVPSSQPFRVAFYPMPGPR